MHGAGARRHGEQAAILRMRTRTTVRRAGQDRVRQAPHGCDGDPTIEDARFSCLTSVSPFGLPPTTSCPRLEPLRLDAHLDQFSSSIARSATIPARTAPAPSRTSCTAASAIRCRTAFVSMTCARRCRGSRTSPARGHLLLHHPVHIGQPPSSRRRTPGCGSRSPRPAQSIDPTVKNFHSAGPRPGAARRLRPRRRPGGAARPVQRDRRGPGTTCSPT